MGTQFSTDYALSPETLEKQIIKLSNTSRAIEAKDLQYRVLRITCITNNKLHQMKILDTPKCPLCNHPTQNSTHRFYYCPQALQTWQLLTHITSQTLHPHDFSITTAILNITHTHTHTQTHNHTHPHTNKNTHKHTHTPHTHTYTLTHTL